MPIDYRHLNSQTLSAAISPFSSPAIASLLQGRTDSTLVSISPNIAIITAWPLGLLASVAMVSAVPAPDQSYNGDQSKRQIDTCEANTIYCNSFDSFSICTRGKNGNREVFFGTVAEGTYCDEVEDRIRANNYGDCSPDNCFAISMDKPSLSVTRYSGFYLIS